MSKSTAYYTILALKILKYRIAVFGKIEIHYFKRKNCSTAYACKRSRIFYTTHGQQSDPTRRH